MKKPKHSFEKSVGGVVYREAGSTKLFLLLHYESGHWDFPKGHMKKGENEIETLKREIAEETGISQIEILSNFKGQTRYFYTATGSEFAKRKKENKPTSVLKKVIYFLVLTSQEDVKISSEHIGYEWLPLEEALKKITYKNSKSILKEVDDFLRNNQ